jgi:hypothetical protein
MPVKIIIKSTCYEFYDKFIALLKIQKTDKLAYDFKEKL